MGTNPRRVSSPQAVAEVPGRRRLCWLLAVIDVIERHFVALFDSLCTLATICALVELLDGH